MGRAAGNTLVIADASLSARHCEILVNGPEIIVRDLGSRNGTMVNGRKLVNQQSQLKSGQVVRFGSVEARLELDNLPSGDTLSEMTAVHSLDRIMREQRREQENPKTGESCHETRLVERRSTRRSDGDFTDDFPGEGVCPSSGGGTGDGPARKIFTEDDGRRRDCGFGPDGARVVVVEQEVIVRSARSSCEATSWCET